jgi:hypothetical protein
MVNRTKLIENLHDGICEVTFVKSDGTERTLRCTLSPQHLPTDPRTTLTEQGSRDPSVVPVWDTDSNAWKSFRMDSVLSFRPSFGQLNG